MKWLGYAVLGTVGLLALLGAMSTSSPPPSHETPNAGTGYATLCGAARDLIAATDGKVSVERARKLCDRQAINDYLESADRDRYGK
jgi:hypothetical protein